MLLAPIPFSRIACDTGILISKRRFRPVRFQRSPPPLGRTLLPQGTSPPSDLGIFNRRLRRPQRIDFGCRVGYDFCAI
jgi:hypothetical protein